MVLDAKTIAIVRVQIIAVNTVDFSTIQIHQMEIDRCHRFWTLNCLIIHVSSKEWKLAIATMIVDFRTEQIALETILSA